MFGAAGLLLSSWVSRIASVRDALQVKPGTLGLVLLSLSVGAVCALPAAGGVVGRLGTRRSVGWASTLACVGIAVTALAAAGPIPLLAAGLFLLGAGIGVWDVAMNVEGSLVEQALGRSIMPRFHAAFSIGTVAGALIGAGVEVIGVPARTHLLVVAAALALATPIMARAFLVSSGGDAAGGLEAGGAGTAWLERRTVLIGVLVLAFAFTEGSANDWLAVATVSGYHESTAVGSLFYGIFVAAMTTCRLASPALLDRFGRVAVLRSSSVVAALGVGFVVAGPDLAVAALGAALWGLGAATGFPIGMSAASDDPARSHARVATVSTIAYAAFLAGPPCIGFVANHVGIRHALAITGVLSIAGLLLAGAARAPRQPVALGAPVR